MFSEKSTAVTRATRGATCRVMVPGPQATSRTRASLAGATRPMASAEYGANSGRVTST